MQPRKSIPGLTLPGVFEAFSLSGWYLMAEAGVSLITPKYKRYGSFGGAVAHPQDHCARQDLLFAHHWGQAPSSIHNAGSRTKPGLAHCKTWESKLALTRAACLTSAGRRRRVACQERVVEALFGKALLTSEDGRSSTRAAHSRQLLLNTANAHQNGFASALSTRTGLDQL